MKMFTSQDSQDPVVSSVRAEELLIFSLGTNGSSCAAILSTSDFPSGLLKFLEATAGSASYKLAGNKDLIENVKKTLEARNLNLLNIKEKDLGFDFVYFRSEHRIKIEKEGQKQEAIKKKVLIIDDSKTIQKILSQLVLQSKELELLGCADSPSHALSLMNKACPDVITLDIQLPEMNGVDFFKQHLKQTKIPVVMISSLSLAEGPLVLEGLNQGVFDYIQKPSFEHLAEAGQEILLRIEQAAQTRRAPLANVQQHILLQQVFSSEACQSSLVFIGCSTGGPQTLEQILCALPPSIPPILVVQHIPQLFSKALAERLDGLLPFRVKEAEAGEEVKSNHVYIAPGGIHMAYQTGEGGGGVIALEDTASINRHKPSVDVLFRSAAQIKRKKVVGALLTGMGDDGARGLLELKNQGCLTIAQGEQSCIVFGMPRAAIQMGAAVHVAEADAIPALIVECCNGAEKRGRSSR